jgi:hypothetical protein
MSQSSFWYSLLLGWWMVVAMERPPAAKSCTKKCIETWVIAQLCFTGGNGASICNQILQQSTAWTVAKMWLGRNKGVKAYRCCWAGGWWWQWSAHQQPNPAAQQQQQVAAAGSSSSSKLQFFVA